MLKILRHSYLEENNTGAQLFSAKNNRAQLFRAKQYWGTAIYRGGVEGPSGTANAVPLFTVVRIAVPLFKAGRTGAASVPPRIRDCSARAYSTYAWASP